MGTRKGVAISFPRQTYSLPLKYRHIFETFPELRQIISALLVKNEPLCDDVLVNILPHV